MRQTTALRGFSLLELLVVVGIMAMLAGLVIPSVQVTITAQRRDQCREQLVRLADAIERRAEALAQNTEFAKVLWGAAPVGDIRSGSSTYEPTIAYYFPASESDYYQGDLNSLVTGTIGPNPYFSTQIVIGGPFLSLVSDQAGDTTGSDLVNDPWGRPFNDSGTTFGGVITIPEAPISSVGLLTWPAAKEENSFLWSNLVINSWGPNQVYESFGGGVLTCNDVGGDDIAVCVHLYPVLAKETLRRIQIVNDAILAYRRDHGASGLEEDFVYDRDPLSPLGPLGGSYLGADCVYKTLVTLGYLPNPDNSNIYAMDAWGYSLITDLRLDALKNGNLGDIPGTGEVSAVCSGNLVDPGHYGGWHHHP